MNKLIVVLLVAINFTCSLDSYYSVSELNTLINPRVPVTPIHQKMGEHILAEFTGCHNLNAFDQLKNLLTTAAIAAGATILGVTIHQFEPQGMTGVAVLAESHISLHTWPEYGYVAIDVFTCGDHVSVHRALEVLQDFFQPTAMSTITLNRGFSQ